MADIQKYSEQTFESIKHYTEDGEEFWFARELQKVLEYTEWRNFSTVIDKAKMACANSGLDPEGDFVDVNKIVEAGATHKTVDDMMLSRYACYMIVQNGDPRKEVVAVGQTYFAVKTRQQELIEHNKSLAEAAQMAGVESPLDYAVFQNSGYKGLYGGLGMKEIHARKGLKKSQKILDHMGSTELAANLFRATQTDEKLRRDNVQGKTAANQVHYQVGAKVRQTIKELGGTMPENLPTPEKSIQQLEREQEKKKLKE